MLHVLLLLLYYIVIHAFILIWLYLVAINHSNQSINQSMNQSINHPPPSPLKVQVLTFPLGNPKSRRHCIIIFSVLPLAKVLVILDRGGTNQDGAVRMGIRMKYTRYYGRR